MTDYLHEDLTYEIIGAAIEVHNTLGPGFLEGAYEAALAYELGLRQIRCERQVPLVVRYKKEQVGEYRADLVVDKKIILEIKSCPALIPAHSAQALNYLAATGLRLAVLLNFGSPRLQTKRLIR